MSTFKSYNFWGSLQGSQSPFLIKRQIFSKNVTLKLIDSSIVTCNSYYTFRGIVDFYPKNSIIKWFLNGVLISGDSLSNTIYDLNNGDTIYFTVTFFDVCNGYTTLKSNIGVINIIPVVNLSGSITYDSSKLYCRGDLITFTAVLNNNSSPGLFQWFVNGVRITGVNGKIFSSTSLVTGDVVRFKFFPSLSCFSPKPVLSNYITVNINDTVLATVSLFPDSIINCKNQILLNASSTNGGSNPQFVWFINGTQFSSGGSSSQLLPIHPMDLIWVQMSSSYQCARPNPAVSNQVRVLRAGIQNQIFGPDSIDCTQLNNSYTYNLTSSLLPSQTIFWSNGDTSPSTSYMFSSFPATISCVIIDTILGCRDTLTKSVVSNCCVIPNILDQSMLSTSNIFTGDYVVLANTILTIPPGVNISFKGANIQFGNYSGLTVERNAYLEITDNSKLFNCTGRWYGIEVWGESGNPDRSLSSPHGRLLINNSSSISDADVGILAGKRVINSQGFYLEEDFFGGIVIATGAEFTNNNCHIGIESYPFRNLNLIENNQFNDLSFSLPCSEDLSNFNIIYSPRVDPKRNMVHVYKVLNIEILNNNFYYRAPHLPNYETVIGIYDSLSSSININGNSFSGQIDVCILENGSSYNRITKNRFNEQFSFGIKGEETNTSCTIQNNSFEPSNYYPVSGIMGYFSKSSLSENSFNRENNGRIFTGIDVISLGNNNIIRNSIYNCDKGIKFSQLPDLNYSNIKENYVGSTNLGWSKIGLMLSEYGTQNSAGSGNIVKVQIECNEFENISEASILTLCNWGMQSINQLRPANKFSELLTLWDIRILRHLKPFGKSQSIT